MSEVPLYDACHEAVACTRVTGCYRVTSLQKEPVVRLKIFEGQMFLIERSVQPRVLRERPCFYDWFWWFQAARFAILANVTLPISFFLEVSKT